MIHRLTPLFLAGWLLMSSSPAQPGLVTFDDVRKRVRTLLSRQSSPSITELEGTLRELQTLYRAPAEEREKICRWLYGTLLKKGGTHDAKLRMRLIALQTVAVLADEPEWADKLIELALRSGRASLKGVHFWVERALGELRGRGHVLRLMAHAVGKDVRARRIALGGLGRRESGDFQDLLHPMIEDLTAMAGGSDVELQIRALAVLGRIDRPDVLPPILAGARHAHPLVRLESVRALARKVALPGVVSYLIRLLVDEVALVREGAIVALKGAPDRTAVPFLVQRLDKEPMRVRLALNETLVALTGFDLGAEFAPWEGWLKSVKAAGNLEGVTRPQVKPYAPPPEYFDIPVLSDRLLFVVDVSGSMGYSIGENSKEPNRMDRCKGELIQVLKALDARSRFNIIFFEQTVRPWSASGLVRATRRNKQLAIQSVEALRPRGGTDSYGALEMAFRAFRGVDTIYFLSDGVPSVGKSIVQERILQRVWEWNRLRGVRIHSISLLVGEQLNPFRRRRENKEDASRFMRILAEETGGTFKDLR